jgi:ABC-type spermidine/putrescine transport system permease subunit II
MVARDDRTAGRTILGVLTGAYLVWALVPLAYIVVFSFDRSINATRWEGFSLRWWSPGSRASIFHDPEIAMAVRHTVLLALVGAMISLVLGTMLALGIRHLPRRAAFVVYGVLVLAIAFPAVALGGALWLLFSVPFRGFPFGEFGWFGTRAQTLGLTVLEMPFVVLIVSARLALIPFEQEEMATDLGAPPRDVIGRVLLAQLWPAIGAAAVVAITIGFGEFVVTNALRSTDDTRTLASSFMSRDLVPKTYALGAALAAAGFISSALVFAALRMGRRVRS